MIQDVLLPIGSVVHLGIGKSGEPRDYMIISCRIINHESMRAWDYAAVEYPEGMKRSIFTQDNRIRHEENLVYFNHTDIEELKKELMINERTNKNPFD